MSVTWLKHKTAPGLPEVSVYKHPITGKPMLIKKGERCYHKCISKFDPDSFNRDHGITPVQAEAMFYGLAFGWHCPAANPENYDEEGRFVCDRKCAS